MKLRRRLRRIPEFLFTCIAFATIPLLPRRGVVLLASGLGWTAYRASLRLRRVAKANMDVAFGDSMTPTQKKVVILQSFRTATLVMLDLFWFSVFSVRRLSRYVSFAPSTEQYFERGPAVVVTGHIGNWEVMGKATAQRGQPTVSVAAPIKNPGVDRLITRSRGATGQQVAGQKGAVRTLLTALRSGQSVALLVDQNTLPREGGEFVHMFGIPVPVSKAPAALAMKTGIRVILGHCPAAPDGSYTIHALPPIDAGGDSATASSLTQRIVNALEEVIRQEPGQWLWMYKRWKYIPDGAPADRYPFYAKPAP